MGRVRNPTLALTQVERPENLSEQYVASARSRLTRDVFRKLNGSLGILSAITESQSGLKQTYGQRPSRPLRAIAVLRSRWTAMVISSNLRITRRRWIPSRRIWQMDKLLTWAGCRQRWLPVSASFTRRTRPQRLLLLLDASQQTIFAAH